MYPYGFYINSQGQFQPNPPPFSHPTQTPPYYGYRPSTAPHSPYTQGVQAPVLIYDQRYHTQPYIPPVQPTPLPVPPNTPSEVRYEVIRGVLTPVRVFNYNSPPELGRGYNNLHGYGK